MSDTPRTDASVWTGHCGDLDWQQVVGVDFARQLEREIAWECAAHEHTRHLLNQALAEINKLKSEKP